MRSLSIGTDGKFPVKNGAWQIVEKDNEIAQRLIFRVKHILGEWFLNTQNGIDVYNKILNRQATENQRQREIRRVILETSGIKRIVTFSLTLNRDQRRYKMKASVLTENSKILTIEETI